MIPDDLLYAKSHEWARISDQEALVGITNFAQQQLGDITFVELTAVGDIVTEGHEMGSIESVKAASELISPVSGTVLHVNTDLESAPEKINQDPYGAGWLVRVQLSSQPQNLLSPQQYAEIAEGQE
jgi:glycine cleavage system H protein